MSFFLSFFLSWLFCCFFLSSFFRQRLFQPSFPLPHDEFRDALLQSQTDPVLHAFRWAFGLSWSISVVLLLLIWLVWTLFQIVCDRGLSQDGMTLLSLKEEGYKAVFIGIGQFICIFTHCLVVYYVDRQACTQKRWRKPLFLWITGSSLSVLMAVDDPLDNFSPSTSNPIHISFSAWLLELLLFFAMLT